MGRDSRSARASRWCSWPAPSANQKWNAATPTYYVIDHRGKIRYKWVGSPGTKAIDAALEKLIQEAEGNAKKVPK